MCCSGQTTSPTCRPVTMPGGIAYPSQCGCGCMGQEQTAISLNRYREHLKAELNHVDARIEKLEGNHQP